MRYVLFLLIIIGGVFFLQGCCRCCGYTPIYSEPKYTYRIQLSDSLDKLTKVMYSNSTIIQQSDTNFVEWQIFLKPAQTAVYIETNSGWDTVVYEMKQPASPPQYTEGRCGEYISDIKVPNPTILSYTFDTASVVSLDMSKTNPYDNRIIVVLRLKK